MLRHRRGQLPGRDRLAAGHANHACARGPRGRPRVGAELAEGFRYVVGHVPIRSVLLLLAIVSLMGMPYTVLMPVVATQVLHGRAHTLGFLMAASGAGRARGGALPGVTHQRHRPRARHRHRGGGLRRQPDRLLALSRVLWLSLRPDGPDRDGDDGADGGQQHRAADARRRGQAGAGDELLRHGVLRDGPLRQPAGRNPGHRVGASNTIGLGGIACVVGAALFFRALPELRRLARPTYVRLGILPEIAEGLRSTSRLPVAPEE